jgi:hypothetical protein
MHSNVVIDESYAYTEAISRPPPVSEVHNMIGKSRAYIYKFRRPCSSDFQDGAAFHKVYDHFIRSPFQGVYKRL